MAHQYDGRKPQGQGARDTHRNHAAGGHGGARGHAAGAPLTELHAAYNFVPLADWVHLCPWSVQLSHDLPFSDGLSGTIEFSLTSHTHLLVGGTRDKDAKEVQFFRMPGDMGAYAIPGTSLRGMIRNVLEIAAFGRFRCVDNRALGVRDLASAVKHDYQLRFAGSASDNARQQGYKALSRSAWLRFADGRWWLERCEHARVDYTKLDAYAGMRWNTERENGKFRPTALEKYQALERSGKPLDVFFKTGKEKAHPHSRGKFLIYRRAFDIAPATEGAPPAGLDRGRLVLTGHPGRTKHMDFVFAAPRDDRAQWSELPAEVMDRFLAINGDSDEWAKRWRLLAMRGEPVPVFYIVPQGQETDPSAPIDAIGLSQMFKLPYRLSLHEAIRNSSTAHLEGDQPDFAEAIFGYLDDEHGSLRSRVSFSMATAEATTARPANPVTIVLGGPKPTYFPNYIVQPEQNGKLAGRRYATLMDPRARLRGWKRYPVKDGFEPTPAAAEQHKVATTLHPLAPGATFRGRLRVHNLRPVELGALLWALTWGGKPALRHALGMGKPNGFGQVSFAVGACHLQRADGQNAPDVAALMGLFEAHMEAAARATGKPGWANSAQLRELLAMADPARARGATLTHMHLDNRNNEFAKAKGNERDQQPALVLGAYTALRRRGT